LKFSKKEVEALKIILKKMEDIRKEERIRIASRRKSQLQGKRINKGIEKRKKPIRVGRKITKKRSTVR
jgi:hypothetical protein